MRCSQNINNKWSEIPYPHEEKVFHGLDVNSGSWPLNYFKKDSSGNFFDLNNEGLIFDISHPSFYDFKKELLIVEKTKENITPEQIKIAEFWGNGVPLNQWIPIIMTLINTYKITPPRSARIMSAVQNVISDGFVICWYFKYLWDYPRPIQLKYCFDPVLTTPIFPTYPSGHSVISAAAAEVLSYFFPSESKKLAELAETASISRLYGGIHFKCDLTEGLKLGKQIGKIAVDTLKKQGDKDNSKVDVPILEFLDAPIIPKYNL